MEKYDDLYPDTLSGDQLNTMISLANQVERGYYGDKAVDMTPIRPEVNKPHTRWSQQGQLHRQKIRNEQMKRRVATDAFGEKLKLHTSTNIPSSVAEPTNDAEGSMHPDNEFGK